MAPGKTSPRLLHDLLTYDPRYEERAGRNLLTSAPPPHDPRQSPVAAVPYRNCRHTLHIKSEQSRLAPVSQQLDATSVYKVASYCKKCLWHVDVAVDFGTDAQPPREACRHGNAEYPLHHFVYQGEDDLRGSHGISTQLLARTFRFRCSAPPCAVQLEISIKPPTFSDHDVETLTNQAQLRQRWERSKQLAGERADAAMARRVDAPDYLITYLNDSLNPAKGKARIPLLNRKFLKTFGQDCDSILTRLGFTKGLEEDDDGTKSEVWYLPKPEEAGDPLDTTLRNTIEDARYELNIIMLRFPEMERKSCRHQPMYPPESRQDIERVLACADYSKLTGRTETRSANHEEDHPYYASLGAVGDFTDALVLFAFTRQVETDLANQSYYFECLEDLAVGRNSEMLQMQVSLLASKGVTSKRDLEAAYRSFGIDPAHADVISDDHIIGSFRARLSDVSRLQAEDARSQLRVLGDARNSDRIRAEAADAMETYEQAMAWLDLDINAADDFVTTMFTLKTQDNPLCIRRAQKALTIVAEERRSERLRHFMNWGTMAEPEMDIGEAYALFNVDNRTLALDLDVLKTTVDIANPDDVEKLQKAFAIIQQDQTQNLNNCVDSFGRPGEVRRNSYPLKSWPVGLRNIGNTCYLNSVLQFLFTIKPLREMILNCDDYFEEPSPEALATKKVGRTAVTVERVVTAQKFVRELRTFFKQMIQAPADTVQPTIDLASLALCRTDDPETAAASTNTGLNKGMDLGSVNGLMVSGPLPQADDSAIAPDQADSVMGENTLEDNVADADDRSDTSMQAMDLGDEDDQAIPAQPTRPPPIPPRPDIQNSIKIGRLEESARQQDAAEVMGNIFDLVSCAIKGEDVMREGEQYDTIKRLFYSDVTTVQKTSKGVEKLNELRNHYLISPGGRDCPIYATLDNDFGLGEMEGGGTRYDFIDQAAPFQIINVRRLQFERGMPQYDRSHISLDSTLFMDRYLAKTQSLDEIQLLKLRESQWAKQQQLREVEQEKQILQATGVNDLDLADTIEETSLFLQSLAEEKLDQTLPGDEQPQNRILSPPSDLIDALHDKARQLKENLAAMEVLIQQLEADIDNVFKDCRDHPYRLHAVFTHSGDIKGGHYWIYIYDFQSNIWRSYNDDCVTPADEVQIFKRKDNASRPHVSTGVVYVRADLAQDYTEAVHRHPQVPGAEEAGLTATDSPDATMGNNDAGYASSSEQVKYHDLDVLEGVEEVKS